MMNSYISQSYEFKYCIGYPFAVVGEVLTLPSQISLQEFANVIKPLTPESADRWATKAKEIAIKVIISFVLLLSIPYHLTFGLIGVGLCIVANLFRKNVTLISDETCRSNEEEFNILRVCTFNTALLPDIINNFKPVGSHIHPIDGSLEERVAAIAAAILKRDDDIVCLQEVFNPRTERLLINRLSKRYPHIACHVGSKAFLFFNSGLMIFSKRSLSKARFRPFTVSAGIDRFAGKGVMAVSLDIGHHRQMTILNTHLNSYVGLFGWLDNIDEVQISQWEDINSLAEKCTSKNEAKEAQRIICGDFNDTNPLVDAKGSYQMASAKIDHIFVSQSGSHYTKILDVRKDDMGNSSDHPALSVTLSTVLFAPEPDFPGL